MSLRTGGDEGTPVWDKGGGVKKGTPTWADRIRLRGFGRKGGGDSCINTGKKKKRKDTGGCAHRFSITEQKCYFRRVRGRAVTKKLNKKSEGTRE